MEAQEPKTDAEMPVYDRDNLPEYVPGGASWADFTLREPLHAIRVEGAFQCRLPLGHALRDSLGVLTCADGWMAIDQNGDPFPIDAKQFDMIYHPYGGSFTAKPSSVQFARLAEYVEGKGGSIGCMYKDGEWSVMVVFGEEAEGSPMAGGAAHGIGTLDLALEQAARECGLIE